MKYYIIFIFVSAAFAAIPKDICETCLPTEECPIFKTMSMKEQSTWIEKFPCKVPSDIDQESADKYVCCSNNIWGVENSEQFAPAISHEPTGKLIYTSTEYYNNEPITNEPRYGADQFSSEDSDSTRFSSLRQWYSERNNSSDFGSDQRPKDNSNRISGSTIVWSNNRNTYWNERSGTPSGNRPSSRTTYWNERSGGTNSVNRSYNRNTNWNARPTTNTNVNNPNRVDNRNTYWNSRNTNNGQPLQGHGFRSTPAPFQNTARQPNSFNNRGSSGNQNRSGNSVSGQCDRLTSFPPSPQSGCCGREATDDDRITEHAIKHNHAHSHSAHDSNSWLKSFTYESGQQNDDDDLWSLLRLKESEEQTPNAENVTVNVENRISGGQATELYQYPWTVHLLATFVYDRNRRAGFNCGGSLISAKYALSAGHCFYETDGVLQSVEVYLAEYDKRTFPRDCKGSKCIENILMYAQDVIMHPQYNDEALLNDIALLRLQGTAPYTDYIRPICLPITDVDRPEFSNLQFEVTGWGRNGLYASDIKQSTVLHLVSRVQCRKFYPNLTDKHLCAAGYRGADTCKGDSGGPLMILYRGRYYVAGLVSGKRSDTPCGTAVPSLYTNVYHYLNWIRENIRN